MPWMGRALLTITASPVEEDDRSRRPEVPPLGTKPSHGEIAHRAYELFLARGAEHGLALDDWLEAERQLTLTTRRSPRKSVATSPRRKG